MTNGLHLPASIPDLSISFSSWVDDVFINPLLEALRKAYPDVRHKRFEGGQFQTETIGIWLNSIPSFVVSAAREHGLDHTPSPDQPGQMAFFVSNALTRRTASDNWNATPKRYNEQGAADPSGPVELTNYALQIKSNPIRTIIEGVHHNYSANFRLEIAELLSVSAGHVFHNSGSSLDVSASWLTFLLAFTFAVNPHLGTLLSVVADSVVSGMSMPAASGTPGAVLTALIPQEILIRPVQPPGWSLTIGKHVFHYNKIELNEDGCIVSGGWTVDQRVPNVTIVGPGTIVISDEYNSVTRAYSLQTRDLRAPLQIQWSAGAIQPGAKSTSLTFSDLHEGLNTRQVIVHVSDIDGIAASAEMNVVIHAVAGSPICLQKPWLPECERLVRRRAILQNGQKVDDTIGAEVSLR